MGVDTRDKLLVGVSYEELEDFFEKVISLGETDKHVACENSLDVIECYFDYISPYYDSDKEDWFIGFKIPNHQEVNDEWWEVVKETAYQFELLTGLKPRIKGGAHVY